MKKCFSCKLNKPLFLFRRAKGYMREAEQGRLICCRRCRLKKALNGSVVVRNNGKFEVVELTKFQAIKEYFKR